MSSVAEIMHNQLPEIWQELGHRFRAAKIVLCLVIGFSALFGYLLAHPSVDRYGVQVTAGMLLLAAGAATLNSLQEMALDSTMRRTRNRPLPSGRLSPQTARRQAFLLILLGLLLLADCGSLLVPALGIVAIGLYNGVYTRMKQMSIWALAPGAVCGGLPPLIGYCAGGGGIVSAQAVMIFFLLVLWQVPHFCLVLLRYQQEYQESCQPNFIRLFSASRVRRLLYSWIMAFILVLLVFTVMPLGLSLILRFLLVANAMALGAVFLLHAMAHHGMTYNQLFFVLNLSLLCHMLLIVIGRL